ncbi:MAG: hypothetical protein IPJ13_15420 [Saprospiraceae bacterium]|nr:hypothetical protein [Saprospiraceae bacterium]
MKDHLGNTRLVYSDTNNDGIITVNTEILQESHYYPFGLEFQGHYIQQSGYDYRYKYNDIERLKDLDIGIDMAYYRVDGSYYGKMDAGGSEGGVFEWFVTVLCDEQQSYNIL